MQSCQMAEVNLNIVKCGRKHLQQCPAHESNQERIMGGEMQRRREEKKIMTGVQAARVTMYQSE